MNFHIGFQNQPKTLVQSNQISHCELIPILCASNKELKTTSRLLSSDCPSSSKKIIYKECEKSTQVDEIQDADVKKDLFACIESSTIQEITTDNIELKTNKDCSDYQSSNLSNTNGIIACAVILPYEQDNTLKAIQQLDIKEIQENIIVSEVSNFECKKIECKDVELCVENVEEKDVNASINISQNKISKFQQPLKRRGRPKKIHIISTKMVDTTSNQHEKIPLEGIESSLSTIPKKCERFNRISYKDLENLIPKEVVSCINSIQPLNKSQVFEQTPFPSKVVENQEMQRNSIDLQPSSSISTSLTKRENDELVVEETQNHRRKLGQDGKPRNRAVMDILGLGVEMHKVERVFTRKKPLGLPTSIKDANNNNIVVPFALPFCKQVKSEDSIEPIDNKSLVLYQPSKRGRGRPRKWPIKDIKKDDHVKAKTENEIISKSTHELYVNFHGKRTNRKSLSGNKSLGCARCSIMGWTWRCWTRNGAKQRLRQKIQEKETIDVSFRSTTSTISSLQSARTNRATLRKLISAVEGSDKMKFNHLKVC